MVGLVVTKAVAYTANSGLPLINRHHPHERTYARTDASARAYSNVYAQTLIISRSRK